MKRAILTALVLLALSGCSRETPKEKEQQATARDTAATATTENMLPALDSLLEAVTFDLNHDGTADTIRFFRPRGAYDEAGDFFRVDFVLAGKGTFTFVNYEGGWVYLDKSATDYQKEAVTSVNFLPCRELSFLKADTAGYVALAIGLAYASSPGILTVFSIGAGSVRRVYNAEFDIAKIADIDKDGRVEIVGSEAFGEAWGSADSVSYTSYVPWSILVLPTCEQKSRDFLRHYNLEHYYGFAESDSPQVVVHPRNGGKPFVMDEKAAYARYGK